MKKFNNAKKRVLREFANSLRPTPFKSDRIGNFNKVFNTQSNETYAIIDNLMGAFSWFPREPTDEDTENPNTKNLIDMYYAYRGKTARFLYIIGRESVVDRNITIPDFISREAASNWFMNGELWNWRTSSPEDKFETSNYAGKVYAFEANTNLTKEIINQSFLDGKTEHCVLDPIKKWCETKMNDIEELGIAKGKDEKQITNSQKKYNAILNKINKKLLPKYKNGIPENEIEQVCEFLSIRIHIAYPFCNEIQKYGEDLKDSRQLFNFTNTRLNHIDCGNYILNNNCVEVSKNELLDIINELEDVGKPYAYKKNEDGINSVYTFDTWYKLEDHFQKAVQQLERKTGLDNMKIDDIQNSELSNFILNGTHYNTNIMFGYKNPSVKCIDQIKAYYNFKSTKYYQGFLGKITDFRKTDKIQGVGLYLIKDLQYKKVIVGKGAKNEEFIKRSRFIEFNEKANLFKSNNIYTSAELALLDDMKYTYKIVAGCWGVKTLDFEFGEDMLNKCNKEPYINDEGELKFKGISYYAKITGAWDSHNTHSKFYIRGNDTYAGILQQKTDNFITKMYDDNEICIGIKKEHNYHLGHITAFILAYQRINMLDQLVEMDISKINSIYVDGIYYEEHSFKLLPTFEYKNTETYRDLSFRTDNQFITNVDNKFKFQFAEPRETYKTECFIGAGGNGKTHLNLSDTGLVSIVYSAPSNKLCSAKRNEFGVDSYSWNRITSDPILINKINSFTSNIIWDEVSMMSNEMKNQILKLYPNHKHIFCGDIGYQLPCVYNEFDKNDFNFENIDNIVELKTNRRFKCEKLKEIIAELRLCIETYKTFDYTKFSDIQHITDEEIVDTYKPEDTIITYTNKKCDYYTNLLSSHKKWYLSSYNQELHKYRGEVLLCEEKPKASILRHGYTSHIVQGETYENKIYIDINDIRENTKSLYTAISRARYLNQIYFINSKPILKKRVHTGKCNECGKSCGTYYRCLLCHYDFIGYSGYSTNY